MCGVWSRVHSRSKIELKELMFPVKMLAHRGPDSYGWYADSQVALLHTRLSIIDLSGGGQPLQSSDGNFLGIVNGELYDYHQHRVSLENQGVKFKTKSDSEVLLNLFAARGIEGLRGLSGEWSFIFYHPNAKKIFFARDSHGVKPLFYNHRPGIFTLSSEIKALAEESPVLSEEYVKTFMARSLMPQGTSLADCFHVWPGRLYTYDMKTESLTWERIDTLPLGQEKTLKGPEAVEAANEALKGAVKRRLVADVDVGCYLSGGVDSALTTALAVECGAKPKAFTVGFADRDFDESSVAAKITQHLGIEHHLVQMNSKNFIPSLIKAIVAFENPVTNPHGAAKNLLAHMASQQVKVVLSGEGADEWFGGYAYLRIQKLQAFLKKHPQLGRGGVAAFLAQENGRSMNHLDGNSTMNQAVLEKYFQGHHPAVLGRLSKHRSYHYLTGDHFPEALESMCSQLVQKLREDWPSFSAQSSDWDLNTWFGVRVDLLHYILANVGDRQEMSHSLEGRTPFLDPEVIRVASLIDPKTHLRGITEKDVLKKMAQRLLPPEIANRPKHPFFAPIKYFYLRQNQEIIQSKIDVARQATPWLAWDRIERLLSRAPSATSPLEGLRNSTKMLLFSLGVLVDHLRECPSEQPRGYRLPEKVEDLNPFRVSFDREMAPSARDERSAGLFY